MVRPYAPERKAVPQQTASQQQPSPEMLKLRNKNERLKKRIAEQDMRMLEMNRKLDLLLANQRQEQAQAQAQVQAQAMEVQTEAPAEEAAKIGSHDRGSRAPSQEAGDRDEGDRQAHPAAGGAFRQV